MSVHLVTWCFHEKFPTAEFKGKVTVRNVSPRVCIGHIATLLQVPVSIDSEAK